MMLVTLLSLYLWGGGEDTVAGVSCPPPLPPHLSFLFLTKISLNLFNYKENFKQNHISFKNNFLNFVFGVGVKIP